MFLCQYISGDNTFQKTYVKNSKTFKSSYQNKKLILDVVVEDDHGRLYDFEMNNYDIQLEDEIRFFLSHLSFGVKRIFLYTSHAYSSLAQGSALQIMLGADGFPHPGLAAMSAFARRIETLRFVRYHRLEDGIFAAIFSNGTRTVAVITGHPDKQADISCSGTFPRQFADLYGNPIPRLFYRGSILYLSAECSPETLLSHLRPEVPKSGRKRSDTAGIHTKQNDQTMKGKNK